MGVRRDGSRLATRNHLDNRSLGALAPEERCRASMSITAKPCCSGDKTSRVLTGETMPPVATWVPTCSFPLGTVTASLPQIEQAKQVCRTCPASKTCLRWALDKRRRRGLGRNHRGRVARHRQSRALGESGSAEIRVVSGGPAQFPSFPALHLCMHKKLVADMVAVSRNSIGPVSRGGN